MAVALYAIGLVMIVEGLVYVLAPSIVEDLLAMIRSLPVGQRRTLGLLAVVSGAIFVWAAKTLGV
ncbi:hypothetical protein shim_20570 [Shimia sp. SK013]|uniref:DUF2065 domain-containing protein n=1 Tax=Shimia sp. SK013 TaxID=1389006 RepID=UPI0006B57E7A|nr:DUF2065 domain-containing protein [Shimia sp. SK013]KPA21355.1 hypothetical protein shim_20570 [Shimia sp. SK013]